MITFKAPDGKDPAEFAQRIFADVKVKGTRLQAIADHLVQEIAIRTADSESYNGSPFQPYSEKYATRKGYSEPDLRSMNNVVHMMDFLSATITDDPPVITIGIIGNDQKSVVARVQDQGTHTTVSNRTKKDGSPIYRLKKLGGINYKGGRAIYNKVTKYKARIIETVKKKTFIRMVSREFDTTIHHPENMDHYIKDRVGIRRHRTRVKEDVVYHKKVYDKTHSKVFNRRVGAGIRIPARPFLGLTAEDREYVLRNIVSQKRS
jgi:hypothetical protein